MCCTVGSPVWGVRASMAATLNVVTYNDICIDFLWEEWVLMDPSQKNLCKDVMLETFRNLTAIGYTWE